MLLSISVKTNFCEMTSVICNGHEYMRMKDEHSEAYPKEESEVHDERETICVCSMPAYFTN